MKLSGHTHEFMMNLMTLCFQYFIEELQEIMTCVFHMNPSVVCLQVLMSH